MRSFLLSFQACVTFFLLRNTKDDMLWDKPLWAPLTSTVWTYVQISFVIHRNSYRFERHVDDEWLIISGTETLTCFCSIFWDFLMQIWTETLVFYQKWCLTAESGFIITIIFHWIIIQFLFICVVLFTMFETASQKMIVSMFCALINM